MVQAGKAGSEAGIIQAGANAHDQTAQQGRVNTLLDIDFGIAGLGKAAAKLDTLQIGQGMGGHDIRHHFPAPGRSDSRQRGKNFTQARKAAVIRHHANKITHKGAEAFSLQHGIDRLPTVADVERTIRQNGAQVGIAVDQSGKAGCLLQNRVKLLAVSRKFIERRRITTGKAIGNGGDRY